LARQRRFHDLRLQIPNIGGRVAEPAEQYRPGEGAQPGGKQQRLDLVGIHPEIPPAQTLDGLPRHIVAGLDASH
jgi:hypothetical protein